MLGALGCHAIYGGRFAVNIGNVVGVVVVQGGNFPISNELYRRQGSGLLSPSRGSILYQNYSSVKDDKKFKKLKSSVGPILGENFMLFSTDPFVSSFLF